MSLTRGRPGFYREYTKREYTKPDIRSRPNEATAIDLDGTERHILEIAARYGLSRSAVYQRLVKRDDGRRELRPLRKSGPKPTARQSQ